jgi:hypothetical protein
VDAKDDNNGLDGSAVDTDEGVDDVVGWLPVWCPAGVD